MTREEAPRILQAQMEALRRDFGVVKAGIFGSVARDETRNDSDIDVVVTMPPTDLFTMVHLKDHLEQAFHAPVDVVRDRADLSPRLRKWIEREAI